MGGVLRPLLFVKAERRTERPTRKINAALLAAQMLSLCDDELREKLRALREKNTQAVIEKDRKLQDEIDKILEA